MKKCNYSRWIPIPHGLTWPVMGRNGKILLAAGTTGVEFKPRAGCGYHRAEDGAYVRLNLYRHNGREYYGWTPMAKSRKSC